MPEPVKEVIPMIQKLADEAGKKPLDWLITDDHVTIVFMDGTKQRFERANIMPAPRYAAAAAVEIATPAPSKPKGKSRTSKKK